MAVLILLIKVSLLIDAVLLYWLWCASASDSGSAGSKCGKNKRIKIE